MKTLRHRSAGLLTTSLLLAGVSALAPTSVRAATTCSFGGLSPTCHLDFIFDKQGDKTLKLTKLPTVGMGTIQFKQQAGIWVVDVDFIPDLEVPPSVSGMLEYDLTIAPLPNLFTFLEAGLAIIGPPVGDPQFKVKKFATGLEPMLMADETVTQSSGIFDPGLKTISVRDEYFVTMGSINSFQNSFTQVDGGDPEEVPSPLPLLGAGAAFGFSRRLRTRVLAARGA
jgi:hypothetical protein